ncbi:MAG: hypothetical protein ACOWWM_21515 [Desulfobacterales bacterium]
MTEEKRDFPDFFEDNPIDPIGTATGGDGPGRPGPEGAAGAPAAEKKKAGFYLPTELIDRFDRKFHELKLAGYSIGNKSSLLEAALIYALNDLDRGEKSDILQRL